MSGHVAFLRDAAKYFRLLPTRGEDSVHWANVYNAENCDKAAERIIELEKMLQRVVVVSKSGAQTIQFLVELRDLARDCAVTLNASSAGGGGPSQSTNNLEP